MSIFTFATPPIDVQIARTIDAHITQWEAELLAASVHQALEHLDNRTHAYIWARYIGIDPITGELGESCTFPQIATELGQLTGKKPTREYVSACYYRASHHIRGHMLAVYRAHLALAIRGQIPDSQMS